MIETIAIAVIIAVIVGLLLLFVGGIIKDVGSSAPIFVTVGSFLVKFAWLIGLIAGALFFFTGGSFSLPKR